MPMTPLILRHLKPGSWVPIFNVEVTGISEDKSMVDLTVAPELVDFDGFINYGTPIFLPLVSQEKGKDEVTMTKASDNFILQPVFSKRA